MRPLGETVRHIEVGSEKIDVFPPTSLKELGFKMNRDRLGVLSGTLTPAVVHGPTPILLVLSHHPWAAGHLTQLTDSVAPIKGSPTEDAVEDYAQIQVARRNVNDVMRETHAAHAKDPIVAKAYGEFVGSHMSRWKRALDFQENKRDVFDRFDSLVIGSLPDITTATMASVRHTLSHPRYRSEEWQDSFFDIRNAAKQCNISLEDFVTRRLRIRGDNQKVWTIFTTQDMRVQTDIMQEYLSQLTPQERVNYSLSYEALINGNLVVDPNNNTVVDKNPDSEVNIDFHDHHHFTMTDPIATLEVDATRKFANGIGDPDITNYIFSPTYLTNALWGVIACTVGDGEEFLPQKAVSSYIETLGIDALKTDVVLGRVLLAYFTEGLPEKWAKKRSVMPLHALPGSKQPMESQQAAAFVSLEDHKRDLLKARNSPLRVLKRYTQVA